MMIAQIFLPHHCSVLRTRPVLIKNHATAFLAKVDPNVSGEPEADQDTVPADDSLSSTVTRQAEETTEGFVIKRIHERLSGHEFEYFIAHLPERMGYTVRVTQKSSDGGIDVIAHPVAALQNTDPAAADLLPDIADYLSFIGYEPGFIAI